MKSTAQALRTVEILRKWQSAEFLEAYETQHMRLCKDLQVKPNDGGEFVPVGLESPGHAEDNNIVYWRTLVESRSDLQSVKVYGFLGSPNFRTAFSPGGLDFSASGRVACSGDAIGDLILWDVLTGRELRRFHDTGRKEICSLAFSADDSWIVTGHRCGTVSIRNIKSGVPYDLKSAGGKAIQACGITSDGRWIVAVDPDGVMHRWERVFQLDPELSEDSKNIIGFDSYGWRSCECARNFAYDKTPSALLLSHDGATVVIGYYDGTVITWDAVSGVELARVVRARNRHLVSELAKVFNTTTCIAMAIPSETGDGRWLGECLVTVDSPSHELRILRVINGDDEGPEFETVDMLSGHHEMITSCAVSKNGSKILSGGYDNRLRLWDVESRAPIGAVEGHEAPLNSLEISPDGRLIITSSKDKTLRLWSSESGKCLRIFQKHPADDCAFHPDGKRIVVADCFKLTLSDLETGKPIREFMGHEDEVWICRVTPDGSRIVSASRDRTVRVWNVETGEAIHVFEGHTYHISACSISPDSKWIASASLDKTIQLWDLKTGTTVGTIIEHEVEAECCVFSPNGRFIASAAASIVKVLVGWNCGVEGVDEDKIERVATSYGEDQNLNAKARKVSAYRIDAPVWSLAYTRDSRFLLVGTGNGYLQILDSTGCKCLGFIYVGGPVSDIVTHPLNHSLVYLALTTGVTLVLQLPSEIQTKN